MTFKKFLFNLIPITKFRILEESMLPTLTPGSFVLVEKISYKFRDPKIGEIVVFFSPEDKKLLIKRIVDFYDGWALVLGDNQKRSIDSRHFGLIRKEAIIGHVFYTSKFK